VKGIINNIFDRLGFLFESECPAGSVIICLKCEMHLPILENVFPAIDAQFCEPLSALDSKGPFPYDFNAERQWCLFN
jgi:hypothetical protein